MAALEKEIYQRVPHFLQNLLVTLYNFREYRKRHGGNYRNWLRYYQDAQQCSRSELEQMQSRLLRDFINNVRQRSPYYKRLFESIGLPENWTMNDFYSIPVHTKKDVYQHTAQIYTIPKSQAMVGTTGGTTGMSLKVYYTWDDMQNRFAMLDLFRARYGYVIGKKVAWFNGKDILTSRDIKRNRFWKDDWVHNIRYYSTFHIKPHTVKYYVDNLNRFRPMFIVGYPSCIHEIAKCATENNYALQYQMTAIFPTSETLLDEHREVAEKFFGCKMINQYASGEGAPFILECSHGNLHMELLSGFFEVLGENGGPATEGELVITSFTTHGTPLIRYAIGDYITLSGDTCTCGNNNPLVKRIEGRTNEYVFTEECGKINQINIINCSKAVKGIIKFQVTQATRDAIVVKVVKDASFCEKQETIFLAELRQRLGANISITFDYVDDIPREKSGKYRVVKQTITG